MMRLSFLFSLLIGLAIASGCGLSPVPDLPSLEKGDGDPGFGTGGTSAGTGGGSGLGGAVKTGGDPGFNLAGAGSDPSVPMDNDLGGMGGQL
jgi:hypothetical protein